MTRQEVELGSGQAIQAADFVGLVPTSRGAHCRPRHPRLASLWCSAEMTC